MGVLCWRDDFWSVVKGNGRRLGEEGFYKMSCSDNAEKSDRSDGIENI